MTFMAAFATASDPNHRRKSFWYLIKKGAGCDDTCAKYTKTKAKGRPDNVNIRCLPVLSKNRQLNMP